MLPFIIILIGIILIIVNLKDINKEKKEEKSFENILKNKEISNDTDYGMEIFSIRKDLAETVMDIQKEIDELRRTVESIKSGNKEVDNKIENNYLNTSEDVISEIDFSKVGKDNQNIKVDKETNKDITKETKLDKTQTVKSLIEEGLSEEEICEKLSIGRGEVLLIKSLLKK